MDGTLTQAVIDFAEMRRRVAACAGLQAIDGDILDVIASWPAEQQAAAHAAIAEVEAQALRDMQLMPGVLELSQFLDGRGVPRALVTRNVNGEAGGAEGAVAVSSGAPLAQLAGRLVEWPLM
jgi:beta-phosphoglucomutase-like phosphatase (HAD superfamily)